MNAEFFIAKRLIRRSSKNIANAIVRISIVSIALAVSIMIIAMAIVVGFKNEISNKVVGFGAHIVISNYDSNNSLEAKPINNSKDFINSLKNYPAVEHVQAFGIKAGIVKTKEQIEGIVLKGVDQNYNWHFIANKLKQGSLITINDKQKNNEVLISQILANRLNLKVNDEIKIYFIYNPPRYRKFVVKGIYETGLEEFDKLYVFADLRHIQKLNDWDSLQISGFEVLLNDFDRVDELANEIDANLGYELQAQSIKTIYPEIFDWLDMLDVNVQIIIVLMVLVAVISIVSMLLILILERTNMIGLLKALGMNNLSVQKIFFYYAAYIILVGISIGNLIGLVVAWIQIKFSIFKLPQESYYMSHVPIEINPLHILFINLITMLVCLVVLSLPSMMVKKITPVKAIRFN